jgi:DNA invertase Pin-like site-specific DNA recombinase
MTSFVAYYRVSTKKQGDSGLGLDAQKTAVESHVKGAAGKLLASYREVESGKRSDRPELAKALLHAKRSKSTLLVAKLDRLSRNVHFLSGLMESKVPFVCCDNPTATPVTIHIFAALAEQETKAISERTTKALAEARKEGTLLGSARPGHWDGREDRRRAGGIKGRKASAKVRREDARKAHEELCPILLSLRAEGLTLAKMADRLNAEGWKTRQGKDWNVVGVCRFLKQCEKASK